MEVANFLLSHFLFSILFASHCPSERRLRIVYSSLHIVMVIGESKTKWSSVHSNSVIYWFFSLASLSSYLSFPGPMKHWDIFVVNRNDAWSLSIEWIVSGERRECSWVRNDSWNSIKFDSVVERTHYVIVEMDKYFPFRIESYARAETSFDHAAWSVHRIRNYARGHALICRQPK